MSLVDSHCHLDFPEFAPELEAVISRARTAGVSAMVSISTSLETFPRVLAIAEQHDGVYCSVGVHPHEAEKEGEAATAERLIALAEHPKVVGVGETGLDFYYEHSPRVEQEAAFRAHIAAARATQLPLIVHTRDAEADTARVLADEMRAGAFTGLIHCFTSSRDFAEKALDLGFSISFSGILTFKKAEEVREVARMVPAERMLVETDAPYLAPVPHRGKRNEPSYVVETAKLLAELRGASPEELARQTTDNFYKLFTPRGSAMKATILGCGSSGGVPRIGGHWGACDPNEPRNRRRRCSLLVERGKTTVLVDTSPDLREQLLSAQTEWLDGVLFTHDHADQTHGIDDLRAFLINRRRRIDVYMDTATEVTLMSRFGYCFATPEGSQYPAILNAHSIHAYRPVVVQGEGGPIEVLPILQDHGDIHSLGFRFGGLAYSSDLVGMPQESFAALEGLDVWIVDALRYRPHPSHAHLDLALEWIARLKPKRAVLTNMHIDLDYQTLKRELPPGVEPAHDGMVIELPD